MFKQNIFGQRNNLSFVLDKQIFFLLLMRYPRTLGGDNTG